MDEPKLYNSKFAEDLGKGIKFTGVGILLYLSLLGTSNLVKGCAEAYQLYEQSEFVKTQRERLSKLEKPPTFEKLPKYSPLMKQSNL